MRGLLLRCIYFRTRNLGYVGGENGIIYTTKDGGITWDTINLTTTNQTLAVQFMNDSLGFSAGFTEGQDQKWNFITTNGGSTWEWDPVRFPYYDGGDILLDNLSFLDSNNLIAVSYGVYKRKWSSLPASVHTETSLVMYLFVTTYPNPAVNRIHCRLSGIFSNPGAVLTAQLYNVVGEKVMDLTVLANRGNNGNTSEFDVDVSGIPAGVYMLRYSLGEYSYSRPVVVLH